MGECLHLRCRRALWANMGQLLHSIVLQETGATAAAAGNCLEDTGLGLASSIEAAVAGLTSA